MLTYILLTIAAVIAAILIYAAMKPNTFSISRSTDIQAPPSRIFPFVNDLADHEKWSPFARDPKVNNHIGNPSSGTGARVDFDGSCAGTLSITGSNPSSKVAMRLQMTKPMKCDNQIEFNLAPPGKLDPCHLGDERRTALSRQADERVHQLRQDGGQAIRARACRPEKTRRAEIAPGSGVT